jgi:hypothetical protein
MRRSWWSFLILIVLAALGFMLYATMAPPPLDPALATYYDLAREGRGQEYSEWVIEPGVGVGPIKFGMTPEETRTILGPPELPQGSLESYWSLGTFMRFEDGKLALISLGLTDHKPHAPLRDAIPFSYANGINMDSTEEEVLAAFGPPTHDSIIRDDPNYIADLAFAWFGVRQKFIISYDSPPCNFVFEDDTMIVMTVYPKKKSSSPQ